MVYIIHFKSCKKFFINFYSLFPPKIKKKNFESDNCGKGSGNQSAAAGPTSGDTQSEVMSTSTISRMEETQRMKELEDTFEERYMKLGVFPFMRVTFTLVVRYF